jgi:hypothetical protein
MTGAAVQQDQLTAPTSNRWAVTKAVRASGLPAPSRLLMLTLADVAEVGTAEIPEKHTPSLSVLADETGLDRSTVRRHLASLEVAGWLVRLRPDPAAARSLGERTRYRLTVPSVGTGRGSLPPPVEAEVPQGRGRVPPIKNRSSDQVRSKPSRDKRGAAPKKAPSPAQEQARDLAQGWWLRYGSGQAQTFIAVQQVIAGVLRNGVERDLLAFALDDLGKQGKPISGGTLTYALGARANGSRASPNGHRAYQNPADLSAYQSGL